MELLQLPKSLRDINLTQWVEWKNNHGDYLLKQSKKVKTDEEKLLFESDFYTRHYCHYTESDYDAITNLVATEPDAYIEMLKASAESVAIMQAELMALDGIDYGSMVFDFKGIDWQIMPPVSIAEDKVIEVEDFEKIQELALLLHDLKAGKTEAFYDLCANYLHPINNDIPMEAVKSMIVTLPANIALCIKYYLEDTMNLYVNLRNDTNAVTP